MNKIAYWLKDKLNAWLEQLVVDHPALTMIDFEVVVVPDASTGDMSLVLNTPAVLQEFEPTWLGCAQIMDCVHAIVRLAEGGLLDDWGRPGDNVLTPLDDPLEPGESAEEPK